MLEEVFSADELPLRFTIDRGGREQVYRAELSYCGNPVCTCSDVNLGLFEQTALMSGGMEAHLTFMFDYRTGKCVFQENEKVDAEFKHQMTATLVKRRFKSWFAKRHARLKKLYRLYRQRHPHTAMTSAPAVTVKVGRNERCPCGSGKKYTICCLGR